MKYLFYVGYNFFHHKADSFTLLYSLPLLAWGKWRFLTATERPRLSLRLGSFLSLGIPAWDSPVPSRQDLAQPLTGLAPGGLVTLNCMRGAMPNRKLEEETGREEGVGPQCVYVRGCVGSFALWFCFVHWNLCSNFMKRTCFPAASLSLRLLGLKILGCSGLDYGLGTVFVWGREPWLIKHQQ